MMPRVGWLSILGALCLGCQVDVVAGEQFGCVSDRECADDFTCHLGICVAGPILDATPPASDAQPGSVDAGSVDAIAPDAAVSDGDGDEIPDASDSCPAVANADQKHRNLNGVGDACEIPCEQPGDRCSLVKAVCDVAEACGAVSRVFEYEGSCGGTWCGGFADDPDQIARDACSQHAVCRPDPQARCVPIDVCPGSTSWRATRAGSPAFVVCVRSEGGPPDVWDLTARRHPRAGNRGSGLSGTARSFSPCGGRFGLERAARSRASI